MENAAAKKKLIKAKNFHSSFQRAPCLTVHLTLPSLSLIPQVTLAVDQRQSSGLFGKEYTVYKITTNLKIAMLHAKRDSDAQNEQITFTQFRRYSDFVNLHSSLQKKFPRMVLPPLPPKVSTKSTSPTSLSSEKKQNESRRRWLTLWLQYILLNANFQRCDLVKDFVIAGDSSQLSNLWETGNFAETTVPLDFGDDDEVSHRHSSVDSKSGIPPPSSTVDVINEAAFYKSTQETHTVLR